jgi:tRNA G10  N-methylase Trm11
MAPELALKKAKALQAGSVVLDPMVGSGTVMQAAAQHGHRSVGFDVDPLAVLMTQVATSRFDADRLQMLSGRLMDKACCLRSSDVHLPWFDEETEEFSRYWFAGKQRRDLKRLAYLLHSSRFFNDGSAEADILRIAMSRLIIRKDSGASLARDVSHSRPHRVSDENDFDVFGQFEASVRTIMGRLASASFGRRPKVRLGDARKLGWIRDGSVDMVMTSPPYLNAIDYMRGHRLSLIWLGHSLAYLRNIRSNSIGAERGLDTHVLAAGTARVRSSLGRIQRLPPRHFGMIDRYSFDLLLMTSQVARVLKPNGKAVFVVGNSCLKDVFISNSRGVETAAQAAGLTLTYQVERDLPDQSRYLPMPKDGSSSLGRRMRTETILTFTKRPKG